MNQQNEVSATRYHDISCGHRVAGHESKCAMLHGHNYRVHFTCVASFGTDQLGRVIDFSVMKEKLCMWLEENWDHRFLAWEKDPVMRELMPACESGSAASEMWEVMQRSVVWVRFNPTAENMARYLVDVVGPAMLAGTGVRLVSCTIDETRKCSARFSLASGG